jgi:succinate dehydrogenase/fumarate reductase flavoprotein subunit
MQELSLNVRGQTVAVRSCNTWIIGAGAAGMNAAVHLCELWRQAGVESPQERLAVAARDLSGGASRRSGSDKQTYYKLGSSADMSDTALDFAQTLTASGCCHGDNALVEGLCSLREFYHLVEAGVEFPHDRWGGFAGYRTDHDPAGRATSAGPKTSQQMSLCLQRQAKDCGIAMLDALEVADLVSVAGVSPARGQDARDTPAADRLAGVICLDRRRLLQAPWPPREKDILAATVVLVGENFILAAGGSGELFAQSVYPSGQWGLLGLTLRAGMTGVNLTEWQFGLASTAFRWNVSGSYMQVIPRFVSTDAAGGDARDFLQEYFATPAEMAGAIFLKGYQWPFDAGRIVGGSSLIDMAVHQETAVRGRRVYLDFRTNPGGAGSPLELKDLPAEAGDYLRRTGCTQRLPIQRLAHLNAPAIDIYSEHGIDISKDSLEIALCAQHHNGGLAVDAWWRSDLENAFVIGEMAGTHGVRRPGGAALNAGQVGGLRAAQCIARTRPAGPPDLSATAPALQDAMASLVATCLLHVRSTGPVPDQAIEQIRRRTSRTAAYLRWPDGLEEAAREALAQHRRIAKEGLGCDDAGELLLALLAAQQSLAHVAVLLANKELLSRGGGSRGGYCVLDDAGQAMHPRLIDPRTDQPYRFRPENIALRQEILALRYDPGRCDLFEVTLQTPRPIPRETEPFETIWRQYRQERERTLNAEDAEERGVKKNLNHKEHKEYEE